MHNQRTAIIIASLLGIISWFLPVVGFMFHKESMMDAGTAEGYIVIVAFIISLIVAFSGDKSVNMKGGHLAGAIIPGIIPALFLIIMLIRIKSDDFASMAISFEYGFYLMLIASIAILVAGLALQEYNGQPIIGTSDQTSKSFCTNCGTKLPAAHGQFCEECGNKL